MQNDYKKPFLRKKSFTKRNKTEGDYTLYDAKSKLGNANAFL